MSVRFLCANSRKYQDRRSSPTTSSLQVFKPGAFSSTSASACFSSTITNFHFASRSSSVHPVLVFLSAAFLVNEPTTIQFQLYGQPDCSQTGLEKTELGERMQPTSTGKRFNSPGCCSTRAPYVGRLTAQFLCRSIAKVVEYFKSLDRMFDVRVATKLAQIKTKADPNYYRPIWNKFIMYNNQTSTPFLFFCYSIFRQQTT